MPETPEPHDGTQYSWVMFYRTTMDFFIAAVRYYVELLGHEAEQLSSDPHLSALLNEDVRREFKVGRDLGEAERIQQWLEQRVSEHPDSYDVTISLNHRTARYLKTVGLLYLGFLKQRRNALSKRPHVTSNLLSALDRQITSQEEALRTQGIFANASLVPLLVEQSAPSESQVEVRPGDSAPLLESERPKPVLVTSIEILDPELRARCLDLFAQFEAAGQSERHDTVITEATRILENRLRSLSRAPDGVSGTDLVARAFAGARPALRISEVAAEQEAVHLLFRGVFGFVRNRVHHRLLADLSADRVLQILGLVDYLISVANSAPPSEHGS